MFTCYKLVGKGCNPNYYPWKLLYVLRIISLRQYYNLSEWTLLFRQYETNYSHDWWNPKLPQYSHNESRTFLFCGNHQECIQECLMKKTIFSQWNRGNACSKANTKMQCDACDLLNYVPPGHAMCLQSKKGLKGQIWGTQIRRK